METAQPEAQQQQQAWGYWACRFAPPPQAVACAWKPFAGEDGSGLPLQPTCTTFDINEQVEHALQVLLLPVPTQTSSRACSGLQTAPAASQQAMTTGGHCSMLYAGFVTIWQRLLLTSASSSSQPGTGVKRTPPDMDCDVIWCSRLRVFDLPQEAYQQVQAADPAEAAAEPDTATTTATAAAGGSISWQQALEVHTGETVYDYCWFSGMSAADPASCCFASTSRVRETLVFWFICWQQLGVECMHGVVMPAEAMCSELSVSAYDKLPCVLCACWG